MRVFRPAETAESRLPYQASMHFEPQLIHSFTPSIAQWPREPALWKGGRQVRPTPAQAVSSKRVDDLLSASDTSIHPVRVQPVRVEQEEEQDRELHRCASGARCCAFGSVLSCAAHAADALNQQCSSSCHMSPVSDKRAAGTLHQSVARAMSSNNAHVMQHAAMH